jgi:hypothetical protein
VDGSMVGDAPPWQIVPLKKQPRGGRSQSRPANVEEFRMEIFFAYSRVLKKEREKLRQKAQGPAAPNPLFDKRPKTSPPLGLQKYLCLASACQSVDH